MTAVFLYGTLRHPPLLHAVLGREAVVRPAHLAGHEVRAAEGGVCPILLPGGGGADGILLEGLAEADLQRLDFYEGGFGFSPREIVVATDEGARRARVYVPPPGQWTPGAPWSLADWQARWGAVAAATARDILRQMGQVPAARLWARYGMMLMRGGARVRAEAAQPALTLRRRTEPGDVAEDRVIQTYANYFAVEEFDLRFRHFDGGMSATVNRAVYLGGDAAVVLPYDPLRDRVLLVEQFRMGPHARGEANTWLLEAVAGRVDGGETPEAAAHREAAEEAGLTLTRLIPAGDYYPSPAAMGEYLYTYVGIADLADAAAGAGGLESEAEDIRTHLVPFERLMAMVASGEVNTAPLILLAYWLDRNRAELRRVHCPGEA